MSNRLVIQPTKFVNINNGVEDTSHSYGVRIYDDYGSAYANCWDSIPEDPLDILRKVCSEMNDDNTMAMIDYVQENERGLYIGDDWYEWEEIKDIIEGKT